MTLAEARALDTHDEIDCPSLWTSTMDDDDDAVIALLVVDRALVELAYDDAWTRQTLAADIDDLESFTAVELAVHARLQDTLTIPDDRPIDLVRNDASRPED